jgi:Citrate lyase beta subunit
MADMTRRSLLFSPGDRPALLEKTATTDADVIAFDLEDAVAPSQKQAARESIREVLTDPAFDPAAEVCVRVTRHDPESDLDALADTDVDAVMIPKVSGPEMVARHARLCADRDMRPAIFALLETAGGVLCADEIAAHADTEAVLFGAEDLAADVGANPQAGDELLYARQRVVLAAGSADVDAIDTIFRDFEDRSGLAGVAARARDLGYNGKIAIHPSQVPVINEAFTPDADQIEWARDVVAAKQRTDAAESGVFEMDGQMIDAPLVARAERILSQAEAADELP